MTSLTERQVNTIERVRGRRVAFGYSQELLSGKLGEKEHYVGHIERMLGAAFYTETQLFYIAKLFRCRYADLTGEAPASSVRVTFSRSSVLR